MNRMYLLAGLILSFIIPALNIPWTMDDYSAIDPNIILQSFSISNHDYGESETTSTSNNELDYITILIMVYFIGLIFMISQAFKSLIKIIKIKNSSTQCLSGEFKILTGEVPQPFSFINYIFLPKDQINALIIEHEKIHIQQYHWIDLVFIQLTHIILWFNPLLIFYKRSLKAQHEYLADMNTLAGNVPIEDYLQCMLQQIHFENDISLINQFYSKTIKQRILMITKTKTYRPYSTLYLLVIPVVSLMLFAFSIVPQSGISSTLGNNKNELVIIVDAGHGGHDSGAKNNTGITEKELTLSIARKIQSIGKEQGVNIILTRTEDEAVALSDRITLANKFKADLFLSLHTNYDDQDVSKSGIECILSEKNIDFKRSKTLGDHLLIALGSLNGIAVNGLTKGNALVLKENTVPSVILELGYLSNTSDYNFLSQESNQELISDRIVTALKKYSN